MAHEIQFFGPVGRGFDPFSGVEMLDEAWLAGELEKAAGADVRVSMSSDGGDVFVGLAQAAMLARYSGEVEVSILGLSASIASVVAMSGENVTISPDAMMMVHSPFSGLMGNADDFRKQADLLDKVRDESLIPAYLRKSNLSRERIASMIQEETWISASEAVAWGFADSLTGDTAKVESFLRPAFANNAPVGIKAMSRDVYRDTLIAARDSLRRQAIAGPILAQRQALGDMKAKNMDRIDARAVERVSSS